MPRKRVGFRQSSRKRVNFCHSFEAGGGQAAVSSQNAGEESIAEVSYKRIVSSEPHISYISHISRKYHRGRI